MPLKQFIHIIRGHNYGKEIFIQGNEHGRTEQTYIRRIQQIIAIPPAKKFKKRIDANPEKIVEKYKTIKRQRQADKNHRKGYVNTS